MIVLFDVDDVLISAGHFGQWLETTYNLSHDDTSLFFHGPFKACSTGDADLIEVIEPFLKTWKIPMTGKEVVSHWFQLDGQLLASGAALFDEVVNLGLRAGIATTQESYRKQFLIEHVDRIKGCDFHFVSCDLGYVKPDPEFYRLINNKLGHEKVLFFDDIQTNVEAAREAGWEAYHYCGETSLAAFGIDSL
jgi:putative hydrolase of the HAD superfamily